MSNYIKVTEKGQSPIVVPASNRKFYEERNGASKDVYTIEEPTEEEIAMFFPVANSGKKESALDSKKVVELEEKIGTLETELADKTEALQAESDKNAEQTKKIGTLETELAEAKKQIKELSKK